MGPKRSMDRLAHRIGAAQDIVVPEPQDAKALRFQPRITRYIGFVLDMLRSVRLDDQPFGEAHEVDDLVAALLLALEFGAIHPACAQDRP